MAAPGCELRGNESYRYHDARGVWHLVLLYNQSASRCDCVGAQVRSRFEGHRRSGRGVGAVTWSTGATSMSSLRLRSVRVVQGRQQLLDENRDRAADGVRVGEVPHAPGSEARDQARWISTIAPQRRQSH